MNHKESDFKRFFKGKKITVMGLGLLGRGLGDVQFLADCGAELTVTDLKSRLELEPTLRELKKFKNIKYVLGEHHLEDFCDKDMILKAAGVPLDSPFIAEARKQGIPVEMDESLFAKLAPLVTPPGVTIVGVTGTRGKTTVATLVYEIFEQAKKKSQQIFLAGNIKGVATLPLLAKIRAGDIVILELSSWQLQGFGESKISPHIAVFTNFLDDHLNYYRGDRKAYFKDKSYIYENQKKDDFFIVSSDVLKYIRASKQNFLPKGKIIVVKKLPKSFKLNLPGEHNRNNASFALEVARILKIKETVAKEAILNFKGVPYRQELVKKVRGIEIYNDTTSTTPDAIVVALEALGQNGRRAKNIILIMGGADKGLDMSEAVKKIKKYCKAVVLIPGTGTNRFKKDLRNIKEKSLGVTETQTLEVAIKHALALAEAGDRIVFSPGFASFGMFKNEFDRGEKFNKVLMESVKALPKIFRKTAR